MQCSDNDFGLDDVSRDFCMCQGSKIDLVNLVFAKYFLGIPGVIKRLLEAINV